MNPIDFDAGYYEWFYNVSHPFVQAHFSAPLPYANMDHAHPTVVSVHEFMIITCILSCFSDINLFVVCLTTNIS